MAEEDTTAEEVAADPVEPAAAEPEVTPAKPAEAKQATATASTPVNIDVELAAKEALADQLDKGEISYNDYVKALVVHDRNIVRGQRELNEPVKKVGEKIEAQEAAKAYWRNWGGGVATEDVAQTTYGKTVSNSRAQALYKQAIDNVIANPRNSKKSREEIDVLGYDKWMDLLDEEAKGRKKPVANPAQANTDTRSNVGSGVSSSTTTAGVRTARDRMNDGEYDLGPDLKRLGMM